MTQTPFQTRPRNRLRRFFDPVGVGALCLLALLACFMLNPFPGKPWQAIYNNAIRTKIYVDSKAKGSISVAPGDSFTIQASGGAKEIVAVIAVKQVDGSEGRRTDVTVRRIGLIKTLKIYNKVFEAKAKKG